MQRADSLEKTVMLGKIEVRERGMSEDEKVDGMTKSGLESEQTLGDSEGQGSLTCFSTWGRKESDMT